MKTVAAFAAILGSASLATCHYTCDQLVVNDELQGSSNTYIRKHQNSYMPTKFKNVPDGSITPLDKDFSANKGAVASLRRSPCQQEIKLA